MQINVDKIIDICQIIPERIWNIYLYGSRVYGTYSEDSDYDILVVASSLDRHREIKVDQYNIHIWTLDAFIDKLWHHDMGILECFYAPVEAVLLNKMPINFIPNNIKLKNAVLSQSHRSWINGKMKLQECDIYRGQKSIFHSLRILDFGLQILEFRKIIKFSSFNYIWDEIDQNGTSEWKYYKSKYFPLKLKLERAVRQFGKK